MNVARRQKSSAVLIGRWGGCGGVLVCRPIKERWSGAGVIARACKSLTSVGWLAQAQIFQPLECERLTPRRTGHGGFD